MKRSLSLLPISLAAALAVAGCGGGSSDGNTNASPTAAPAKTASATTVDVRKTDLGRILVDRQGRTLYMFEADKNDKSACSGACASAWPPLTTTGAAVAGTGAAKKLLGTTKRSDGTLQATYNGWPLYLYAGDSAAGQTTGQGLDQFGAEWYVLAPTGKKVEEEGS